MSSAAILFVWMLSGVVFCRFCHDPKSGRFQWTPMALILGPLWLPVAVELRKSEPVS